MPRLTQRAIGEHLDLSRQAVAGYVKRGVIDPTDGLEACRIAYIRHLREQAAGRLGRGNGEFDLTEERARLAHHQANKAKLEHERLDGELVALSEVERTWSEAITSARSVLLGLPARVAQVAIAADSLREIEEAARTEVFAALENLACQHADETEPAD